MNAPLGLRSDGHRAAFSDVVRRIEAGELPPHAMLDPRAEAATYGLTGAHWNEVCTALIDAGWLRPKYGGRSNRVPGVVARDNPLEQVRMRILTGEVAPGTSLMHALRATGATNWSCGNAAWKLRQYGLASDDGRTIAPDAVETVRRQDRLLAAFEADVASGMLAPHAVVSAEHLADRSELSREQVQYVLDTLYGQGLLGKTDSRGIAMVNPGAVTTARLIARHAAAMAQDDE